MCACLQLFLKVYQKHNDCAKETALNVDLYCVTDVICLIRFVYCFKGTVSMYLSFLV